MERSPGAGLDSEHEQHSGVVSHTLMEASMSACFHCIDRSASGVRSDSLGSLVSNVAKYQLVGVDKSGVLASLALKVTVPSQTIGF